MLSLAAELAEWPRAQPIGERAIPGQTVDQKNTAPFGVGAFMLAAKEMALLGK